MLNSRDDQLVRRAQSGDGRAFEALHRRHFRAVWQCLFRQGLGPDDADDLTAETFVRAYRALPKYRCADGTPFLPFLLRIAANLAKDQWRRAQVERESPPEEPALSASAAELAVGNLAREDEIARVRRALTELPESDRQLIALCYEQELSRAEVAEVLGKPSVSAVTSHLNRALARLKSVMEKLDRQAALGLDSRVEAAPAVRRSDDR
jgi:RNA polymerase sigma-70 factor (ECF subfamily)